MTQLFSQNTHYTAKITQQEFCKTPEQYGGQPQLLLKIKLLGKANQLNDINFEHGSEDLPEALQMTRTVYLDLGLGSKNLGKTKRILAQLGFEHTDPKLLSKLHPQHPKHFSLVGKDVLVRVWYKQKVKDNGDIVERDNWYIVDDRPVETFDLSEFEALLKENEEAYSSVTD